MDKKELKKTLETVLLQYGFKYYSKEKTYYSFTDGLITAVDIQKSSYDDYYYINYGFRINDANNNIQFPKVYQCDVGGRFIFEFENGKKAGELFIDLIDKESFSYLSEKYVKEMILPVLEKGISELFIVNPEMIKCAFTPRAKELFGIT